MNASSAIPNERRTGGLCWWKVAILGVVHAVAWYAMFPPIGLWWLAFVVPAPLAWAAVRARSRRAVVAGIGLPMFLAWLGHQWWVGSVSGLGLVPLCGLLAAWSIVVAILLRRVARSPRFAGVPLAFLLPPIWILVEVFRGDLFLDGYPWYLLGQPLVERPELAQVADIGGVFIVAALPAAVGGLLVDLGLRRLSRHRSGVAAGVVAVLAVAWVGYGAWRVGGTVPSPGPTVLAIQTDLPQSNQVAWSPEEQWRDVNAYARLTLEALDASGGTVDLVAWPETMLPGVGLEPASTRVMTERGWWPGDRFATLAVELQTLLGTPLLLGSPSFEGLSVTAEDALDWDARYNSTYLLDDGGVASVTRYDKLFLTPFGETMPYISAWSWLENLLLDFGARGMRFDLVAGRDPVRFELVWSPKGGDQAEEIEARGRIAFATPICFEDTVPAVCRRLVWEDGEKAARFLVNASNDGWFGTHEGGRSAHLQLSRFRCIENRVPMVRVVNTGRSASIDAAGRLIDALPSLEADWLEATVGLDERRPPFAVLGRWPASTLALVGLGLVVAGGRRGGTGAAIEAAEGS